MRSPSRHVLSENRTLIVKMGSDMIVKPGWKPQAGTVENFDMWVDVEVLLSLMCFMPLLNDVHCLIKFSTLKFLKSCHRNRLEKHLPLVVRIFGQQYFSLKNFPFTKAIDSWRDVVKKGRQGDV